MKSARLEEYDVDFCRAFGDSWVGVPFVEVVSKVPLRAAILAMGAVPENISEVTRRCLDFVLTLAEKRIQHQEGSIPSCVREGVSLARRWFDGERAITTEELVSTAWKLHEETLEWWAVLAVEAIAIESSRLGGGLHSLGGEELVVSYAVNVSTAAINSSREDVGVDAEVGWQRDTLIKLFS